MFLFSSALTDMQTSLLHVYLKQQLHSRRLLEFSGHDIPEQFLGRVRDQFLGRLVH